MSEEDQQARQKRVLTRAVRAAVVLVLLIIAGFSLRGHLPSAAAVIDAIGPMAGMEMRLSLDTMRQVYGDRAPEALGAGTGAALHHAFHHRGDLVGGHGVEHLLAIDRKSVV